MASMLSNIGALIVSGRTVSLVSIGLNRFLGPSPPLNLRKSYSYSLSANPSRLLSKSSYGTCAVSKEAGRADKYADQPYAIVRLSGPANRKSLVLD